MPIDLPDPAQTGSATGQAALAMPAALAFHAEVAEREAWADQLGAAVDSPALAPRLKMQRLADQTLLFSVPSIPLTLFNRVQGLGLSGVPCAADVDALPRFFAQAPAGRWAVQPAPGAHEAACEHELAARGYRVLPQRMAKMARDLRAAPQTPERAPAGLRVAQVSVQEAHGFVEPIVVGMGLPPWFRDWLTLLPGRAGWRCYAALEDDQPVAAAAMFVHQDIAWLGMATTLPSHRGRGAQRALMLQRLTDATRAGCSVACTETGAPQEGQPHPSYSNMLGSGFQRVATRLSWALPG